MVYPDAMMLTKSGKSFSATFTSGIMYTVWGTPYVPSGWLIPFNYIKVGREISGRSKVRLIVPHSEGQSDASASVYPCYYEITYQLAFGVSSLSLSEDFLALFFVFVEECLIAEHS